MIVRDARIFATDAHASINQMRKYTHDDYIVHPTNVAYLVELFGGSEQMIAAAYLHDVLEDVAPINPEYSFGMIGTICGMYVACMVNELTDITTLKDGNRETRKQIERDRIETISKEAKTVKLADLIDNSLSIVQYDPNFARIYLREKDKLLPILKDCSHPLIWDLANDILIRNKKLLGIQ